MVLKRYQEDVVKKLSVFVESLMAKGLNANDGWELYWNEITGGGISSEYREYKDGLNGVPQVCAKIPTGGGKTFVGCASLAKIFNGLPLSDKLVIWLVPSDAILTQTLKNLQNRNHHYRKRLDSDFPRGVEVLSKEDLLNRTNFHPNSEAVTIGVVSVASFRINAGQYSDRKVFQDNGALDDFLYKIKQAKADSIDGVPDTSLISVIRAHNPVVVVDESHNAQSDLSREMLKNLNPSFVLELTATPREDSNVFVAVSPMTLKKANMIKLPIIVYKVGRQESRSEDNESVILNALRIRESIEKQAIKYRKDGGNYIRPIILFQAEVQRGTEDAKKSSYEKIKEKLIACGIPAEEIAIKVSGIDELKDIDLMSEACKIKYIITVNALKEGWDCPFAYVLATIASRGSRVDVEQIVGRILRQPYTKRHGNMELLNTAHVVVADAKFQATLDSIIAGLEKSGFLGNKARDTTIIVQEISPECDLFSTPNTEPGTGTIIDNNLGSVDVGSEAHGADNMADSSVEVGGEIVIDPRSVRDALATDTSAVDRVLKKVKEVEKRYLAATEEIDEGGNMYAHVREEYTADVATLKLKQIFKRQDNGLYGDDDFNDKPEGYALLDSKDRETYHIVALSADIDFLERAENVHSVDISENSDGTTSVNTQMVGQSRHQQLMNEIRATPDKISLDTIRNQIVNYILNKKDNWIDREVKQYVDNVLSGMDDTKKARVRSDYLTFAKSIKEYLEQDESDFYMGRFRMLVEMDQLRCWEHYPIPKKIRVENPVSRYGKSLYEKENSLVGDEPEFVERLTGLDNVLWWHKNPEYWGFTLRTQLFPHYPDLIVRTTKKYIILVEVKGEHLLRNYDTVRKMELGDVWQSLANRYNKDYDVSDIRGYRYYMAVKNPKNPLPDGAKSFDEVLRIISAL